MLFEDKPLKDTHNYSADNQTNESQSNEDIMNKLTYDMERIESQIKLPKEKIVQEHLGTIAPELEEKKDEVPYKFAYLESELIDYMKDLITIFSTNDHDFNLKNKQFLIDQIYGKLKDQAVVVEKDLIDRVLNLLKDYLDISTSLNDNFEFLYRIASFFYKVGIDTYTMEQKHVTGLAETGLKESNEEPIIEAGIISHPSWVILAFAYIADAGLTYRKYLDGRISTTEFYTSTSLLSLSTIGGLVGSTGGVALGYALGTMLLPGLGGVVGSVVGGLSGGYAGEKIMLSNYQELENRIDHAKQLRSQTKQEVKLEQFHSALMKLDSNENDSLSEVENKFFEKQKTLNEKLFEVKKSGSQDQEAKVKLQMQELYQAYKDIRSKKTFL